MNLNHRRDAGRHPPGPVPANPAAGNRARPPPTGPPAALPQSAARGCRPASPSQPGIAAAS